MTGITHDNINKIFTNIFYQSYQKVGFLKHSYVTDYLIIVLLNDQYYSLFKNGTPYLIMVLLIW